MIAGGIAAAVGLAWWAGAWATGMQPLSGSAVGTAPLGLAYVPHTRDAMDTGPPVLAWRRGGRFVVTLWLHNSASVPVTVTGVDHTNAAWVGDFSGPTLAIAGPHIVGTYTRFHPLRIPADGERALALVLHANARACPYNQPGTSTSQDAVTLHFTVLGAVHDTQTIPLGDEAVVMAAPTAAACRA